MKFCTKVLKFQGFFSISISIVKFKLLCLTPHRDTKKICFDVEAFLKFCER